MPLRMGYRFLPLDDDFFVFFGFPPSHDASISERSGTSTCGMLFAISWIFLVCFNSTEKTKNNKSNHHTSTSMFMSVAATKQLIHLCYWTWGIHLLVDRYNITANIAIWRNSLKFQINWFCKTTTGAYICCQKNIYMIWNHFYRFKINSSQFLLHKILSCSSFCDRNVSQLLLLERLTFLTSGSFALTIFGNMISKTSGKTIISTIGFASISIKCHSSRARKYEIWCTAFKRNGYGKTLTSDGWNAVRALSQTKAYLIRRICE